MFKYVVLILLFAVGGYVGYLDALVSLDQVKAQEEVLREEELYRLDQEIAILEKELTVGENVREANLAEDEELRKLEEMEIKEDEKALEQVPEDQLGVFKSQLLTKKTELEEKRTVRKEVAAGDQAAIEARKKRFAEAKKARGERARLVIKKKKKPEPEKNIIERVTEKAKEIQAKKQKEEVFVLDWSKRTGTVPSGIKIMVQDKTGGNTELNPVHVKQIAAALSLMPAGFEERISTIGIVYGDKNMRRGVSGFKVMFLKGEELDLFPVIIHEFGHIWDLYQEVTQGDVSPFHHGKYEIPKPDPTVTYYSYAWKNDFERDKDNNAFPSGYGTSIPPEDFAEAFALYILQGETFRTWARENTTMGVKYVYLKNSVFIGKEFKTGAVMEGRPFDVTKLPIEYSELL